MSKLISQTISASDVSAFYKLSNFHPAPSDLSKRSFVDLIRQCSTATSTPVSVSQYLASLEKNKNLMGEIAEKHKTDETYAPYFEKGMRLYSEAFTKIDALLRGSSLDKPLSLALYELFYECTTPRLTLEKYTEVEQLFQDHTDVLFQDFCVLDRLIDLLKKGCPAVALFVGNAHAMNHYQTWTKFGWETLSEGTMLTVNHSLAANYCFNKEFIERIVGCVDKLIKHHGWNRKALLEVRPSQCHQCFTFGKVQACGQCKKSTYCGPECQKLAWKEHKLACKAPNKK